MRFAMLGSGSRGNATLVEVGDTLVMVDCGFPLVETEARLRRLKIEPERIAAILITHEHGDHASGVALFAERYRIPVWCTAGTLAACGKFGLQHAEFFNPQAAFAVEALEITPITVPHDAREPTQFVFSDGNHRLGLLTDTGSITPHIRARLADCDALILECNHDREMLEQGPYPAKLKKRVGGRLGHLSNAQAAGLLGELECQALQHLVAAHLSEKNNTPGLARDALAGALDCEPDWIQVATQDSGLGWRELR
ncbi:MAG: MBL fold metallo-hydrolase [Gammaproteobacteria bacterium]|nr:MBL fold metallo-hydrolase [Gammaproteobacteria bacterium]MBU6508950.1 MBL fold metallo-hydrolase [Gammaproteobacteria bacterium]MDE2459889.1 MBL fold metallo-hydrolase [Gammaproteobacteria bacterium]